MLSPGDTSHGLAGRTVVWPLLLLLLLADLRGLTVPEHLARPSLHSRVTVGTVSRDATCALSLHGHWGLGLGFLALPDRYEAIRHGARALPEGPPAQRGHWGGRGDWGAPGVDTAVSAPRGLVGWTSRVRDRGAGCTGGLGDGERGEGGAGRRRGCRCRWGQPQVRCGDVASQLAWCGRTGPPLGACRRHLVECAGGPVLGSLCRPRDRLGCQTPLCLLACLRRGPGVDKQEPLPAVNAGQHALDRRLEEGTPRIDLQPLRLAVQGVHHLLLLLLRGEGLQWGVAGAGHVLQHRQHVGLLGGHVWHTGGGSGGHMQPQGWRQGDRCGRGLRCGRLGHGLILLGSQQRRCPLAGCGSTALGLRGGPCPCLDPWLILHRRWCWDR
mmetsp:Transcript_96778/g.166850  ORF Transcript_96778/g.166850 Transcript_96778/m.166850 type:complete len:383 (+) Transcript_96778:563-1711(+)